MRRIRMEDGFVIVGDEAWLPDEWEAEQERRRRERRPARGERPRSAIRSRPALAERIEASPPVPLPKVAVEAGTCLVNVTPSTFDLIFRGAMTAAIADDFRKFPPEERVRWRQVAKMLEEPHD